MASCLALRLTCGWVCNKLLGTRSVDVGLGIINERVRFPNSALRVHQGRHGEIRLRSVNKIGSNPEKSKHLKPTTTKTLGLDIDFANLRRGNYSGDCRIQQMICSTLSSTITWGILTAAPGIRNGRKGYPPPWQHYQRTLLQPTHWTSRRLHRIQPTGHLSRYIPHPNTPERNFRRRPRSRTVLR